MKSATLPSFWAAYRSLDPTIRKRARKAYHLWAENPFHPSLRFKCINRGEDIWAVRITRGYRAIGVFEGDTVTWFWIGDHDDYERFFL
jgi:mRNA-degrading endonuclease RelE of RelBE toxin-antitoxin system